MKTLTTLKKHGKLSLVVAITLMAQFAAKAQVSTQQAPPEFMKATLFFLNADGSTVLADGNLTNYDDVYLNGLEDDAIKMNNFGENFGILRDGARLAIEQRKKINQRDTAFFCMWNMHTQTYRLRLTTQNLNHPDLLGKFEDVYTHRTVEVNLNGVTDIDFTVDSNPDSYSFERFRVVYYKTVVAPPPAPTAFSGFTATMSGVSVLLQWSVTSEHNMEEYVAEQSYDGISFTDIRSVRALNTGGNKTYYTSDQAPHNGDNFYRIRMISAGGAVEYSSIAKITITTVNSAEISIYPNPVVDRRISIMFPAAVTGKYSFLLYSANGMMQPLPSMQLTAGQSIQTVILPKSIAAGVYRIKIISPDNIVTIKTINVL